MSLTLPSYPAFNDKEGPNIATEWELWIEGLDAMFMAMSITDDKEKYCKLYHYLGSTRSILKKLDNNGIANKSYDEAKSALDTYFCPKRNTIYLLNQLHHMKQEPDETMDSFYMRVKSQVQLLNFEDLTGAQITETLTLAQLVNCTNEPMLRTKALKDNNLKLKDFLTHARAFEMANKQAKEITGASATIDFVKKKQQKSQKSQYTQQAAQQQKNPQKIQKCCLRCGKCEKHADPAKCPARNATCHKCGIVGHYGVVCLKSKKNVQVVASNDSDDSLEEEVEEEARYSGQSFMGNINSGNKKKQGWKIPIWIGGSKQTFRIDTGADVTVMPYSLYRPQMGPIKAADQQLYGAGQNSLIVKGMITTELGKNPENCSVQKVYLVEKLKCALLGQPAIEALGLLKLVGSIKARNTVNQHKDRFQGLGNLGEPYRIQLCPDAKPYALTTPRRVALPLLDKVREELQRMQDEGIISKVEESTEWCAGMVVVPKSNGTVRICVDLTKLNKSVKREYFLMPSVDETLAKMTGAKVFSKLDANSGFWQIKLHPATAKLTTFITPFGRFYFNRLPFGLNAAPEYFMLQMTKVLEGLEGVVCQMDDIMVFGKNSEEHDSRLEQVMQRLKQAGVTLNRQKCVFSTSTVTFLGHVITSQGVKPDSEKIEAILQLPEPTDTSGVRSLLGMVNYLGKFIPHLSSKTKPLRDLLVQRNAWNWGPAHQKAFESLKTSLTSTTLLCIYDPNRETVVSADASSYGIGAVLMQRQDNGELQPVAYASRSLTNAEQKYAQIEKEALAVTWACERFNMYVLGMMFTLETDHKPLVPLLSTKPLEEVPVRVQRFRLRLLKYNYRIIHVPGKQLIIADTLSRAPREGTDGGDLQTETAAYVNSILEALPATERRLEEIRLMTEQDPILQQVVQMVKSGWPAYIGETPWSVQPFWKHRAELSITKGLLMKGNRVVIPSDLRLEMLERLHAGHQGITKCRARAVSSMWWPGISLQIEEMVRTCHACIKEKKNRAEPLIPTPLPERPWQKIGMDLCELRGKKYLIVVDYFSRYIEVADMGKTTSPDIIKSLKEIFSRNGIPEIMHSDNGTQFTSAIFCQFAKNFSIHHTTSSPKFAQANGEAERAVQTAKNMIRKCDDLDLALLCYRTTPIHNGWSPSELLMGRLLRSNIPVAAENLRPMWLNTKTLNILDQKEQAYKSHMKENFDSRHAARNLPELERGGRVYIPDLQQEGVVKDAAATRSYNIETPHGTIRRNRKDLNVQPTPKKIVDESVPSDVQAHDRSMGDGDDRSTTPAQASPPAVSVPRQDPVPLRRSTRISRPVVKLNL